MRQWAVGLTKTLRQGEASDGTLLGDCGGKIDGASDDQNLMIRRFEAVAQSPQTAPGNASSGIFR
jgi:hypothetical protein